MKTCVNCKAHDFDRQLGRVTCLLGFKRRLIENRIEVPDEPCPKPKTYVEFSRALLEQLRKKR